MVALVYKNINLHLQFFHWFYFCFVKTFTFEFGIMFDYGIIQKHLFTNGNAYGVVYCVAITANVVKGLIWELDA